MRKIINIIAGFIFGLAPLAGTVILGFVIYDALTNIIGLIIIGILGVLTIWLGINIFIKVQKVGPIEFMSKVHASPDLDNLEPGPNSETKIRQSKELVELIKNDNNLFRRGTLRIYGDWFGEPYQNNQKIINANFDKISKVLLINFEKGTLEINKPNHIFEASTFLKILDADSIKWVWLNKENPKTEEPYYLEYQKLSKEIKTKTNVDWYKPNFYVSLGDPALIIYG